MGCAMVRHRGEPALWPASGVPTVTCTSLYEQGPVLDLWAVQAATSFLSKGVPRR